MGNFINLRHLDITGAKLIKEMPWGMKRLKHLKMLSNFIVGKGTGSSLTDLKRLKFLCRGLCISSLENVADPEDRREAILSDKRDLDELFLEWGSPFDDSRNEAIEKNVLDMLQPPQNLKKLAIKCYGGARFSSWVGDSLFSNMVLLRLEGCENCTSLPSLGLLSSLKDLIIKDVRGLKSIGYEIYGERSSKPFQSLESLCFEGLLEWEHWDPVNEDDHVDRFPRLCKLSIVKCPKLSGKLPDYLPSLEKLVIDKCGKLVVSVSGFPMLCKMEVHGCKRMVCRNEIDSKLLKSMTLSDIPKFKNWLKQSFRNVERLKIVDCEELVHLWQNEICLEKPPQGLHSLASLRDLCIENCSRLVFFPEVCSLSLLKKLEIRFCNSLVSLPEGMDFHNACLERLRFHGCHSLTFIARGQLPSSLKKLEMYNCKQLHCMLDETEYTSSSSSSSSIIDTSISEISSKCQLPANLKHLHIQNCPELVALSSKEQLPRALEYFCIDSCSKLEFIAERFEDNTALRQIVMYNCRSLQTIPEGLHNLSCLQRILISGCPNIIFFPEGGLPNTYLSVSIQNCKKLKALPNYLHSLSSLQQLTLCQCPSITSFPEEGLPTNLTSLKIEDLNIYKPLIEWGLHKLTSLRYLKITDPNALCFPPQEEIKMKLPTSLTHLIIVRFSRLKSLSSKGFQNLTSLERLTIDDCPNLSSFPEVGLSSSLLQLYIYKCPLLKKHCKRDKGREWSKIAHIPCVKIDDGFVYDPEEEE